MLKKNNFQEYIFFCDKKTRLLIAGFFEKININL